MSKKINMKFAKKQLYIILSAILVVAIILTILISSGLFSANTDVSGNVNESGNISINNNSTQNENEDKEIGRNIGNDETQWVLRESISVIDNSPEYEVEMYLCRDKENRLFIELTYYIDGKSRSSVYSSDQIPSLKESSNTIDKLSIHESILNTKYAKLYFFIEHDTNQKSKDFHLCMINLKDGTIKELHSGKGYDFNKIIFSPDKKYGAYSYVADNNGGESFLQIFDCEGDSFLVANNKTADGKLIGKAQDLNSGEVCSYLIDRWRSDEELKLTEYRYSWDEKSSTRNNEIKTNVVFNIKAGRIVYPDEDDAVEIVSGLTATDSTLNKSEQITDKEDMQQKATEVQTNGTDTAEKKEETGEIRDESTIVPSEQVKESQLTSQTAEATTIPEQARTEESRETEETNIIVTTEQTGKGDAMAGESTANTETEKEEKQSDESIKKEAADVLQNFYRYINDKEYHKAYDLIDETIRFNVFTKLLSQMFQGVEINTEIKKSEIDIDYFAEIIESSGLFNNVEIDEIVNIEINNETVKIYYYHSMLIEGTAKPIIMPVITTLRITDNGLKISAFDDGDLKSPPFLKQ